MKQGKLKRGISFILIFALISGLGILPAFAADATAKLTNIISEVKQNNNLITEGGTMNNTDPITVKFSFDVPVKGDGGSEYVIKDDTATFQLSQGFTLTSPAGPFDLEYDNVKIATLTITSEPATQTEKQKILANVVFNGADEVYDGTDNGSGIWSNVSCEFNATLQYDASNGGDVEGDHNVTLLGKTLVVNVPPLPVVINGQKTGTRTGQYIDWKVKVEAKKGTAAGDMSGYLFSDELSAVGTYESDSFKVGALEDESSAVAPAVGLDDSSTTITYTFPSGTTGTNYIFFRTKIADNVFFANGVHTISNTAKVIKDGTDEWSGTGAVSFTGEWIKKVAAEVNHATGVIKWTITANQLGASLNNAVISDVLDSKVRFDSADWSTWDNNTGTWNPAVSITPTGSDYTLGNINTPVLLTITAHVDTANFNVLHTIQVINNAATIKWDEQAGIGSSNVRTDIGFNPIDKSVGVGGYDASSHEIPWAVKVMRSDMNIDLRVMDLLVYGASGFDPNATYEISNNSGVALTRVSADDIKLLTPRYNQKLKVNSFATANALDVTVHTLSKNGVAVADLLVFTGSGGAGIDVSGGNQEFTFKSTVTNPSIYAKNGTTDVYNTATLFSANAKVNADTASIACVSNMLVKDMLTVENATDPNANKNTPSAATDKGFNYLDKSVVFRLHINANGIADLTNDITADPTKKLGNITLSDTLPQGWEFQKISGESYFLIYEGSGPTAQGKLTAGSVPVDVSFITGDFTSPGLARFSFAALTKPYVVLLKAAPTSAKALEYFSDNAIYEPVNNINLSAENWSTGVSASQKVKITSQILNKTIPSSAVDGVLTWTVDYKPNEIGHTGTEIEDMLPVGIDLRTDANGVLNLSDGNIVVKELTLNQDGTYTEGAEVALALGTHVFYDNSTRILNFKIIDTVKAYRFTYKTDVTGDGGTTLTNTVKLLGGNTSPSTVNRSYMVASADVSATMVRSGWIEITKLGENSLPLAGATFAVFAADGTTIIRTGVTGTDGKLALRGLPVGNYTLKETVSPAGYHPLSAAHTITVAKVGSTVTTSIDGKTELGSNKITLYNIKIGTVGDLTISKSLAGNAFSTTEDFDFTVTVAGAAGIYDYFGSGGKLDGTLTFTSCTALFTLKGYQSITIKNLPKDAVYSVTEKNYSADGYTTVKTGDQGTIVADAIQSTAFINTRNKSSQILPQTGNLLIRKSVVGTGADTTKSFEFSVTFGQTTKAYPYTGVGVLSGMIKSGDTISLAHGQSITITGLPDGMTYTVSEADYIADGYKITQTGAMGTIVADTISTASFVNTKTAVPTEPPKPIEPPVPTEPPKPTETPVPTEPTIPKYEISEVPAPNTPNSPDEIIIIDENNVPLGQYHKRLEPDGSFVYIDENGVPLGYVLVPQTGDMNSISLWASLMLSSLCGAGALLLLRKQKYRK